MKHPTEFRPLLITLDFHNSVFQNEDNKQWRQAFPCYITKPKMQRVRYLHWQTLVQTAFKTLFCKTCCVTLSHFVLLTKNITSIKCGINVDHKEEDLTVSNTVGKKKATSIPKGTGARQKLTNGSYCSVCVHNAGIRTSGSSSREDAQTGQQIWQQGVTCASVNTAVSTLYIHMFITIIILKCTPCSYRNCGH